MALWKRLTQADGNKIDVNLDQVAYIRHSPNSAAEIVFPGGNTLTVRESTNEIYSMRSNIHVGQ